MELSQGFTTAASSLGGMSFCYNLYQSYLSYNTGQFHGIALADAAANLVSVMGWQGATISVGYTTIKAGARGMLQLEQALQVKANELYKRYTGMYGGFSF